MLRPIHSKCWELYTHIKITTVLSEPKIPSFPLVPPIQWPLSDITGFTSFYDIVPLSMIFTLEARWFNTGPVPSELRDWFENMGSSEASKWTDLYLLTEDVSLNLKLRGKNVQVKHRLGEPLHCSLGQSVTAHCEQWVKWSFACADAPSRPWDSDPTGLWVPVHKKRRRHRLSADTQETLSEALPTSPPATVEVECTEVTVGDETAWTFCIEAEGPTQTLHDTLTQAGRALLSDQFPVSLPAEQSLGYVEWLQGLSLDLERPSPDVLIAPE